MLDKLKDIFVKENPYELNEKMESIQQQKADVIFQMIKLNEIIADNRKVIHSWLRLNYQQVLNETKKNAGMESIELYAGAFAPLVQDKYEQYIWAKEKYHFLDKVRTSLETDLSVLQSRAKIFSEVK